MQFEKKVIGKALFVCVCSNLHLNKQNRKIAVKYDNKILIIFAHSILYRNLLISF